jgi:hypothetical protein
MRHDLIDEYLLSITPVVFGTGRRLFAEGSPPASFRLVGSSITSTGVFIATYQNPEPVPDVTDKPADRIRVWRIEEGSGCSTTCCPRANWDDRKSPSVEKA